MVGEFSPLQLLINSEYKHGQRTGRRNPFSTTEMRVLLVEMYNHGLGVLLGLCARWCRCATVDPPQMQESIRDRLCSAAFPQCDLEFGLKLQDSDETTNRFSVSS